MLALLLTPQNPRHKQTLSSTVAIKAPVNPQLTCNSHEHQGSGIESPRRSGVNLANFIQAVVSFILFRFRWCKQRREQTVPPLKHLIYFYNYIYYSSTAVNVILNIHCKWSKNILNTKYYLKMCKLWKQCSPAGGSTCRRQRDRNAVQKYSRPYLGRCTDTCNNTSLQWKHVQF